MRLVGASDNDFSHLWNRLFRNGATYYPLYQPHNLGYYAAMAPEVHFVDRSFVAEEQGTALVGVRWTVHPQPSGHFGLSGYGLPVYYVEPPGLDRSWARKAHQLVRAELASILAQYPLCTVTYRDFLVGGQLSFFSHLLLELGGQVVAEFSRVIDLEATEQELFRQIPKSNQHQINWGKKNLHIDVLNQENVSAADIDAFRQLHFSAAGRATRSAATWELQHRMIQASEAFAVMGYLENNLVTAALFPIGPDYCYYGVSASKRELFDRPLSHFLIWEAILYARGRGCRFFEVGEILYPGQGHHPPSEKELGISTFKRGFGGQTQTRLLVSHDWSTA